jgi:OOP family OmpA-OmpF porin
VRAIGGASISALLLFAGLVAGPAAAQEPEATPAHCLGKARLRGGFAYKAEDIEPGAAVVLDLIAQTIERECGGKTILIEGHTDLVGGPEFNQRLSERRAENVKRYLVGRGVPAAQLRTIGYGETRPLSTDPSPEAQALNRRVTFVVQEP